MTSTELGYLSGVTSNIQDQLNGKVGRYTTYKTYEVASWYRIFRLPYGIGNSYILNISGYKYNAVFLISISEENPTITKLSINNPPKDTISALSITAKSSDGYTDLFNYFNGSKHDQVYYSLYSLDFNGNVEIGDYIAAGSLTSPLYTLEIRTKNISQISYMDTISGISTGSEGECIFLKST